MLLYILEITRFLHRDPTQSFNKRLHQYWKTQMLSSIIYHNIRYFNYTNKIQYTQLFDVSLHLLSKNLLQNNLTNSLGLVNILKAFILRDAKLIFTYNSIGRIENLRTYKVELIEVHLR